MKYVNGNDLPFNIKEILFKALEKNEPVSITTTKGTFVAVPEKVYLSNSSPDNNPYFEDYEFMNRDEFDY